MDVLTPHKYIVDHAAETSEESIQQHSVTINMLAYSEEAIEVDLANEDENSYASIGYNTISEFRRYHAYFGTENNFMPSEEKEQDRLDMHHEILPQIMKGKLHLVPLKDLNPIMDVGTGTEI
ncbi:hypothetical protein BDD12DRAFT_913495 [Trichophaea hybrida]|nr:hypothetical protein BDD12DRAFT_913495 [Trichophaea hybrida]